MKTRIVVDSTADILPEYLDQIHTVPLTVSFGKEEYIDGVTIDHRTFYQKLIETDAMPSTSQASPAAFAGGLLNIKPVISIADGEIQLLGKARGSKMGNNLLAQQIQKVGGIDFTKPVLLGYTGLSDVLLQKYIEDSSYLWSASLDAVRYVSIGSVIGAHAGPCAIAVAFFRKYAS